MRSVKCTLHTREVEDKKYQHSFLQASISSRIRSVTHLSDGCKHFL